MEGGAHQVPEGTYAKLARKILKGHRFESDSIVTGNARIDFRPAAVGFDISLDGRRLGNTTDNYFLVYLTELFTDRDQQSLERIRRLAKDARTLQATELQQTVARDAEGFKIGKQIVGYEFGGVTFNIVGGKKPMIEGFNGDRFDSELSMLAHYDDTGQGADLYRCYADGSMAKLRPKEEKK